MIPPTLPEAAVPMQNVPSSSSDYSEDAEGAADDFSSFISQALDSFPANSAVYDQRPSPPPADPNSSADMPFEDANSDYIQSSGANAAESSPSTDPEDSQTQKSSNQKPSDGTIDSAVQNNLAMLLAGVFIPTIKTDHFVPTPTLVGGNANARAVQAPSSDGQARASVEVASNAQTQSPLSAAESNGKTPAVNAPNLASTLKPFNESSPPAKDSPATAATQSTPASVSLDTTKASAQAALSQAIVSVEQDGNPAASATGTTAALNAGTMKSTGQKTENAGRTVQKLPSASASGNSSTGSNGPSAAPLGTTGSGRKDWSSLPGTFDLAIPMATGELHDSSSAGANPVADTTASQAERVANFVSQEALTIKLSGATSLAVSLKLDHQTELFVQLTNQGGQIQASVRCERGSLGGLEGHWPQLQESLARQNVQLLPPENRSFPQGQSAAKDFEQPTPKQRQPDAAAASAPANQTTASTPASKTRRKNGRSGWESWA
jgi:hypothetical protein